MVGWSLTALSTQFRSYHTFKVDYIINIKICINSWSKIIEKKISPVRDWWSTPTDCQLQSHVTQKLGQQSKIRPYNL